MSFLSALLKALARKPDPDEARALAEANRRLEPLPLPDDYWFERAEAEERRERERREAPFAEPLESPRDAVEAFVWFGQWFDMSRSSNVNAAQYDPQGQVLTIEYKGKRGKGNVFYGYGNVSPREAEAFAKANSFGIWTWDNLRVRGSRFLHKKPYWYISGPSGEQPGWMHSEASRRRHGKR